MNILFVGNSYTYYNDLELLFQNLCRENGIAVNAYRVTKGSRKLIDYMDPEDETTHQLEAAIRDRHYDICFIQEQSKLPALDFDTFLSGATHVKRMVGKQADRFFLYATWARKQGSGDLLLHGWTPETMTQALMEAYEKAGAKMNIPVSPVGKQFWAVKCADPDIELHDRDLTHPSYQGSCLAALTHYHSVFGKFPENTQSLRLPEHVLEAFRQAF